MLVQPFAAVWTRLAAGLRGGRYRGTTFASSWIGYPAAQSHSPRRRTQWLGCASFGCGCDVGSRKDNSMGFPEQQQTVPGLQSAMSPVPDCGEQSYRGSGRLDGKRAVVHGGDSGIGRAVAIAFAREGADVLVSYLDEHQDAEDVARLVQEAGRQCVLISGDLSDPSHCRAVIERAVAEFGGIDILVSNAAYQMSHDNLEEISDEEWDYTFRLNVGAYFYLAKAAVAHMAPGSSIIGSSSVNSDMPSPALRRMRRPRQRSPTFRRVWHSCWGRRGYVSTALPPGPSGRR